MTKGSQSSEQLARAAARQRERYAAGGEAQRAIKRRASDKIRRRVIPVIDKIKMDSGCVDCGYREHPAALHFDHIDPKSKRFSIAKGLTRSWDAILAEIAKCEVRCANCHAIRGVREGHLGRPRIGGQQDNAQQLIETLFDNYATTAIDTGHAVAWDGTGPRPTQGAS